MKKFKIDKRMETIKNIENIENIKKWQNTVG
jgi:hypothetical protein